MPYAHAPVPYDLLSITAGTFASPVTITVSRLHHFLLARRFLVFQLAFIRFPNIIPGPRWSLLRGSGFPTQSSFLPDAVSLVLDSGIRCWSRFSLFASFNISHEF